MTSPRLVFDEEEPLGRAFRIDTAGVSAEATDHALLTRVGVGSLIAFQGAVATEYLVGMLDRVTRDLQDEAMVDDLDEVGGVPIEARQRDLLRVVLLGTYRTIDGTKLDTFKRGADSYPLVDAHCWVIQGANLQNLVSLLSQLVPEGERLDLGTFVSDSSARAVADGNKLFQRHAALVGSTGPGKSWAVAHILERASALKFPNLVVLDIHGEYAPLTEGDAPVAHRLRIAGPADAGDLDEGVLHLPWWLLNQQRCELCFLIDRKRTHQIRLRDPRITCAH